MDAMGRMTPLVEALLDASTLRHRVIAENLANAETPGFRARQVRFDAALERAVAGGDVDAARGARPEVTERGGKIKSDGNDVNVEQEVGEMNRNALAYQTLLAVALARKKQMISAIGGRGV
jgi:flagellar basal-body rod protein FlgB